MTEGSKKSGAGSDDICVSVWKFSEKLEFLSDAFTPRKTKSNANEEDDDTPYVNAKPPSAKSSKKIALSNQTELQNIMRSAARAIQFVILSKNPQAPQNNENTDETFGKCLIDQLKAIPGCDLKDDLKITLQQMVLRCKRQVNAVSSTPQTEPPMA